MTKDTTTRTPTPPSRRRELVSIQEVADHLGVAPVTVRRLIAAGKLRGYRVGHAVRLDLNEVDADLQQIPTVGGEH